MVNWLCYSKGSKQGDPDIWTEWLHEQSETVKGKHASVMRFLESGHWESHYKSLKGKPLQGLGEILIKGKVQWRLIGRLDQATNSFIVLMICNHKGSVYSPKNALATAASRWAEIQIGSAKGVKLDAHPR